jgi:hypothetical protein
MHKELNFYFSPKVAYLERLYGEKNHKNPCARALLYFATMVSGSCKNAHIVVLTKEASGKLSLLHMP